MSHSIQGAERAIGLSDRLLKEMGLSINPVKISGIVVVDGALRKTRLSLDNGHFIESIGDGDTVKYLGCTFSGEIVVRDELIQKLTMDSEKLTHT
jgi:hypothetical protein